MSAPILPGRDALVRYSPSYVGEPYRPSFNVPPTEEEESFKSIWRVLRKRKAWIGWVTLAVLLLTGLVCIFLPSQYTGMATIRVGQGENSDPNVMNGPATPLAPDDLKTEMQTPMGILQDNTVALAVIKDLDLQKYEPFRFKPSILGWFTGENARIEEEQRKGLPLDQAPATRERLLLKFAKKLDVENVPDTRLITVAFMNPDPKLAAAIANDIVSQYIAFESRSEATGQASKLLAVQLGDLKKKVEASQQRLADYEKKTGLNSLLIGALGQGAGSGGSTHIPALDKLDTLNQELAAAQMTRISKEAIYHLTQTQNPEVVVGLGNSDLPGIASSAVISQGNGLVLLETLREQQANLKLAYADASTKYGAKNPRLVEIQSQLASVNQQLAKELQNINTRAKNDYLLARQNEDALKAAFANQQEQAGQLNESTVKLQVLAQEASSIRQLYDGLYGQLQQANVQAGIRATNINIADPARAAYTPTRPNPPLYLAIGLAAGLLFGVSSAFIREHMDETVSTPLQVGASVHVPVLASIPYSKSLAPSRRADRKLGSGGHEETSPLILQPKSSIAESYRALRTSIGLSLAGGQLHSLMVTSPMVGDGKTSVAYNTAIAFAHAGRNVLLVDADMRHPRLHELFGVSQSPGLSDVLSTGASVESVVRHHSTVENLSLLPAGRETLMPAELLSSERFDDLLKSLEQKYGLIIFDTPPTLLVTDASVLFGKVNATLAVVRAGVTTRTILDRTAETLERNGSRAVGFVLTAVDTNSIDYQQAYGHTGAERYYEEANV